MCRSGTRSAKAANVLYDLGYENVYSVVDGFEGDTSKEGPAAGHRTVNGWKNAGLAWTYTIRPEQAYPPDRM
jgi:rhodanese-related sulfurtransferase